jgi:hypothetical protein
MKSFISEDPIQFAGGTNWYSYVGNQPVNLVDPLGLEALGLEDVTTTEGLHREGPWYVNLNFNIPIAGPVGLTGGPVMGPNGLQWVVGVGVMTPGVALTGSLAEAKPGWYIAGAVGVWAGGEFGYNMSEEEFYAELGAMTPGFAFTIFYLTQPEKQLRDPCKELKRRWKGAM